MAKLNYIIVGAGHAGISAAEEIRKNDNKANIIIIDKDKNSFYYRAAMKYYLKDKLPELNLIGRTEDFWKKYNIELLKKEVISINSKNKTIKLNDQSIISYDKLLLATGANAYIFPFKGNDLKKVFVMRTLEDTIKIKNQIEKKEKGTATIVGFGVLGLELAEAIVTHSKWKVHLIGTNDYLAPKLFDKGAAEKAASIFQDNGIEIHYNFRLTEINEKDEMLESKFENKPTIKSDFVALCIGANSENSLAKEIGMKFNKGILINKQMETSISDIYAAGDCVEFENNGNVIQLWAPAGLMGVAAAKNITGEPYTFDNGCLHVYTMFFEKSYHALGNFNPLEPKNYVILNRETKNKYDYFKMVLKENKLVGVIGLGEIWNPIILKKVIEKNKPIPDEYIQKILDIDFDYELLL